MKFQNQYRLTDFNSEIIEWDIRSANTSISREYKLVDPKILDKIEILPKQQREVKIGLLMQKSSEFSQALEAKFDEVMNEFLEMNDLNQEWDVLSIRRDAAFVINKEIKYPKIGKYIEFRPKGRYSNHILLQDKDIYIGNNIIDIKGIGDEKIPLHDHGINYLLRTVALCMGTSNAKKEVNMLMADACKAYKNLELPYDFYREFNANSSFKIKIGDDFVLFDNIDCDELLEKCNIEYNYTEVFLPLIKLVCF